MASAVARLFLRILANRMMTLFPVDERQKAFKKNNGFGCSLISIQAIVAHHEANL